MLNKQYLLSYLTRLACETVSFIFTFSFSQICFKYFISSSYYSLIKLKHTHWQAHMSLLLHSLFSRRGISLCYFTSPCCCLLPPLSPTTIDMIYSISKGRLDKASHRASRGRAAAQLEAFASSGCGNCAEAA